MSEIVYKLTIRENARTTRILRIPTLPFANWVYEQGKSPDATPQGRLTQLRAYTGLEVIDWEMEDI